MFMEGKMAKKLELEKGDELRGNSSYGSIYLYRNGGNLGCVASGMRLTQDLQGFLVFASLLAKTFGRNIRPRKDPWILELE